MADELEQRVYPMIEDAYISQDMLSPVDAETLADIGA